MKIFNDIKAYQVSEDLTSEEVLLLVNDTVKRRNLASLYVKSVTVNLPNIFNPVTDTATPASSSLTFSFKSQTKNHVFAAPLVANGTPSFRALTLADVSDYSQANVNYWSKNGSYLYYASGGAVVINNTVQLAGYHLQVTGNTYVSGAVDIGTSGSANLNVKDSIELSGSNPYLQISNPYKDFAIFTEGTSEATSKLSFFAESQVLGAFHQNGDFTIGKTTTNGYGKLQVQGAINQSSVTSSMLKASNNGTLIPAIDGEDYYSPSTIADANYWTKTGTNLSYTSGLVTVNQIAVKVGFTFREDILGGFQMGVNTGRLFIAPRNSNNDGFDYGKEFGFRSDTMRWYLEGVLETSSIKPNAGSLHIDSNVILGNSSAQYPIQLTINSTTHSTSKRATIQLGTWHIVNDVLGNGTNDFGIYGNSKWGIFINRTTGYVLINSTTLVGDYELQVNGTIQQSNAVSTMLKADNLGGIVPAIDGEDYYSPSTIADANYWTKTGNNLSYDLGIVTVNSPISTGWLYRATSGGINNWSGFWSTDDNIEMYLRNSFGSVSTIIRSFGTSYFNGGNVGIGTSSPSYKLDVNTTGAIRLGNSLVGVFPASSQYTLFGHTSLDHSVINNYALLQSDLGETFINSSLGKSIFFRQNNGTKMTLSPAGYLGINIDTNANSVGSYHLQVAGNFYLSGNLRLNALANSKLLSTTSNGTIDAATSQDIIDVLNYTPTKGTGDLNYVARFNSSGEIENSSIQSLSNHTRFIGNSTGASNVNFLAFYESNNSVRQAYIGIGSSINSYLYFGNDLNSHYKFLGTDNTLFVEGGVNFGVGLANSFFIFNKGEVIITSSASFNTHFNYQNIGLNYITQANNASTNFRNNIGTFARFDSSGYLLLNYASTQGSYQLQVNGNSYIAGSLVVEYPFDDTSTTFTGYGIVFNRGSSYFRPATNGDKTLYIGDPSNYTWGAIQINSNTVRLEKQANKKLLKIDTSGYLQTATSQDVIDILGYTPANNSSLSSYVPTSRTITINGVTQNLTADKSWTITIPSGSKWSDSGSNIFRNSGVSIGNSTYLTSGVSSDIINSKLQVKSSSVFINPSSNSEYALAAHNQYKVVGSTYSGTFGLMGNGVGISGIGNQIMLSSNGLSSSARCFSASNTEKFYMGIQSGIDYSKSHIFYINGGSDTAEALYVRGNIYSTDDIALFSDRRDKENIMTIENPLEIMKLLRGVTYTRKGNTTRGYGGHISQEVALALPYAVREIGGRFVLNDRPILGLHTQAIKELITVQETLEYKVKRLEKRVEELENQLRI